MARAAARRWIRRWPLAKGYGFETRNYENRCGSVSLRPAKEEIAFWGHLDVVPPGDGWLLTEPYKPVQRDGYLIGRGADDNKGPALGVMYLLRAFEDAEHPHEARSAAVPRL